MMMTLERRKTGIDVVGDIPWGTHFCLFYETTDDILDTVVPYCKAGLEHHEYLPVGSVRAVARGRRLARAETRCARPRSVRCGSQHRNRLGP